MPRRQTKSQVYTQRRAQPKGADPSFQMCDEPNRGGAARWSRKSLKQWEKTVKTTEALVSREEKAFSVIKRIAKESKYMNKDIY